jgi:hypothetical protein
MNWLLVIIFKELCCEDTTFSPTDQLFSTFIVFFSKKHYLCSQKRSKRKENERAKATRLSFGQGCEGFQ